MTYKYSTNDNDNTIYVNDGKNVYGLYMGECAWNDRHLCLPKDMKWGFPISEDKVIKIMERNPRWKDLFYRAELRYPDSPIATTGQFLTKNGTSLFFKHDGMVQAIHWSDNEFGVGFNKNLVYPIEWWYNAYPQSRWISKKEFDQLVQKNPKVRQGLIKLGIRDWSKEIIGKTVASVDNKSCNFITITFTDGTTLSLNTVYHGNNLYSIFGDYR